jgi:hypothetical protein
MLYLSSFYRYIFWGCRLITPLPETRIAARNTWVKQALSIPADLVAYFEETSSMVVADVQSNYSGPGLPGTYLDPAF